MTLTEKQIDYFQKQFNEVDYCVFCEFISEFEYLNSEVESLILKIFKIDFFSIIQNHESEIFIQLLFLKMFLQKKMIEIDCEYRATFEKYERYIINYLAEFEIELLIKIKKMIQDLNKNKFII